MDNRAKSWSYMVQYRSGTLAEAMYLAEAEARRNVSDATSVIVTPAGQTPTGRIRVRVEIERGETEGEA